MGEREASATGGARPRVVLLGASNVTRGFAVLVRTARAKLGEPLEVLAAHGRGRSYGIESRFLARVRPGIERCGIWRAVERGGVRRALVTDVGNDLLYGVPPERIAAWVERAFERLADAGARITFVPLPTANLRRFSLRTLELWSRLFFPARDVPLRAVLAGAEALDARLRELAPGYGVDLVAPRVDWYGVDPIHLPHGRLVPVWRDVLGAWGEGDARGSPEPGLGPRTLLLPLERYRSFERDRTAPQPCLRLTDGTTVSMF